MKCIYNVEMVSGGHRLSEWQEGVTKTGAIYPLVPTGFNAVLSRQDDLYIVRAGHNGETIAVTDDADVAIERARRADGRKSLAFIDDDERLIVTDEDNEGAELARFAKVSPNIVFYVHKYVSRDIELVAFEYSVFDGLTKTDKPIVCKSEQDAIDKIEKVVSANGGKGALVAVSYSVNRKIAFVDDSDVCNVPTVPNDVKKRLDKAVKSEAKKIRDERKKENV